MKMRVKVKIYIANIYAVIKAHLVQKKVRGEIRGEQEPL